MKRLPFGLLTAFLLVTGCGDDTTAPDPDVDEFDVSPADQDRIDDAADNGDGGEGTYDYDEGAGTLTLTLSSSTFECGPTEGIIAATIVRLTPTIMEWDFDDGGGVTWTRVDIGGTGVVGIWETDEPSLFLILSADGTAQIFGMADCDDDKPQNGDGCYQLNLSGIDVDLDGNLSEWSAVANDGTLEDDQGDHVGADDGADLRSLKVEYFGDSLYVLSLLWAAPSTAFQSAQPPNSGAYRITVRGDNGLSLSERLLYDPNTQQFVTLGDAPEVTAAAGADGIEWRINMSNYAGAGFENIDVIMVEAIDCGSGTCEILDAMDCGYVAVP